MVTKTKTKKTIAKKTINKKKIVNMSPQIAFMEAYKLDYKNIPDEIIISISKDYSLFKDFIQKYGLIEDTIIDKLDIRAMLNYMEETQYKHITDKMITIICKDPEYAADFVSVFPTENKLPELFKKIVLENKDKKYDKYNTYSEKFIEILTNNLDCYNNNNKTLDDLGFLLLEIDPLFCLTHLKANNYKLDSNIKKQKIIEMISKDTDCCIIYLLDNINNLKTIPKEIVSMISKNYKLITEELLDKIIYERENC